MDCYLPAFACTNYWAIKYVKSCYQLTNQPTAPNIIDIYLIFFFPVFLLGEKSKQ